MAKTQIADIIRPEPLFRDSVVERTTELSELWTSGIVESDASFNELASNKGSIHDMPFWNDLSGATEVLSDSGSLTPAKIDQSKDRAVKHFRGRAWSANDLAKAMAGDDPMDRVVELVASYWARSMQTDIVLNTLTGVFATALSGTHELDVSIAAGDSALDANLIGSDAVIDAQNLLGDAWMNITAMAMHSKPFSRLQKLNLIEFVPLAGQTIMIPTFLGRRVLVDDGMPVVAGATNGFVYTTYLFGAGAFAHGEGGAPSLEDDEAVESDRDTLAGDDIFVTRRHFIMHLRGVQFSGTPAGAGPSNAELAAGGNYTKAWQDKNIRVLSLKTNG
mgnify:CR=1 FL=1